MIFLSLYGTAATCCLYVILECHTTKHVDLVSSIPNISLPPSLLLSLFLLLLRVCPSRLVHKGFSLIYTRYSCHLLLITSPPVASYNQTHVNLVSFTFLSCTDLFPFYAYLFSYCLISLMPSPLSCTRREGVWTNVYRTRVAEECMMSRISGVRE